MSFGKYTYGVPIIHWKQANTKLVIGNFCSIGHNVNIYLGGNHRTDWVSTYPFGHINKDKFVWIGNNVTIMSGITIGDGAVIANNSHIVKNVEPYTLVGGNPAQLIKYRFLPEQIEKLLQIKWWFWDDEKINKFTPLLCNTNIDTFINSAV